MRREWASWTENGVRHHEDVLVDVVGDFVIECSYCGIPCSGFYRLWYETAGVRRAVDLDRDVFSTLFLDRLWGTREYAEFPQFLRDWNEDVGWCGLDVRHHEVDLDDLAEVAQLLNSVALGQHEQAMTAGLGGFLQECRAHGGPLFATCE